MLHEPQSQLRFILAPFDNSYKDQLTFESPQKQAEYFSAISVILLGTDKFTFIRKDKTIRVARNADELRAANYLMYRNQEFTDRWTYAFIDKVEWQSDNSSIVHYTTDVWQTWQWDLEIRESFVVREHVNDDSIGANTIEEGLELGEYVINAEQEVGLSDCSIVVMSTVRKNTQGEYAQAAGVIINGVYSGASLRAFPATLDGRTALEGYLSELVNDQKADSVVSIYMVPTKMLGQTSGEVYNGSTEFLTTPRPTNVNGHVPRNKKLLTDPYCFAYVHNNNGGSASYAYEHFSDGIRWQIKGDIYPSGTFKIVPRGYNGATDDYDSALSLSGFPLCSWTNDSYQAYIAQQKGSLAISGAQQALNIGASLAMGNPMGAVGGILGATQSVMALKQAQKQPPQARGSAGSGSANMAFGKNDFFIQRKSIRKEYAEIIDEYFDMFGYKVNRVKIPNIRTRKLWNFVQVNDLSVYGDVPHEDLQKFKRIFQEGIRFWHDPQFIYKYSQAKNNTVREGIA